MVISIAAVAVAVAKAELDGAVTPSETTGSLPSMDVMGRLKQLQKGLDSRCQLPAALVDPQPSPSKTGAESQKTHGHFLIIYYFVLLHIRSYMSTKRNVGAVCSTGSAC